MSEQLVRLYRPAVRNGTLMVTANSIQQQEGSTACGVFSVAAAYTTVRWAVTLGKQSAMWRHLIVLNIGSFPLSPWCCEQEP